MRSVLVRNKLEIKYIHQFNTILVKFFWEKTYKPSKYKGS